MGLHVWGAVLAAVSLTAAPDKVTLYVQEPASLVKSAAPTADVVEELPAGALVTWTKADAPKKGFFKVTHGSNTGFVQRASLALEKPNLEVATKASTVSEGNRALASSGAANKAAAEEAHTYAEGKGLGDEIGQLEKLEAVAASVDAAQVNAHARKVGLVVKVEKKGGR